VRGFPFETWKRTGARVKLDDIKMLLPVVLSTFCVAGMNYPEPVREVAEKGGWKPDLPTSPYDGEWSMPVACGKSTGPRTADGLEHRNRSGGPTGATGVVRTGAGSYCDTSGRWRRVCDGR